MELGIREAWEQARTVFDLGTLELSHVDLAWAWQQTRPFVKLVSREFRRGLGNGVLFERERTNEVELQVDGWSRPMTMTYPWRTPKKGIRARQRFDDFEMALPAGKLGLRLRFRLGEGERSEDTWDMIGWGLGAWGAKKRVETQAKPVLRRIEQRVQNLWLDSWEGTIGFPGTWAQVGRTMHYTAFGADIEQSVKTMASDFQFLLHAAQPYQDR